MKVLMLNATSMNVPFILAAKRLGYDVYTTGNNRNFAGHDYADKYVYGDYSDLEGMAALVEKHGIEGVLCGTSDNCALSAAWLGEYFGWKGHDSYEVTKVMHRKHDFKRFTKAHGIKSPIADQYLSMDEALGQAGSYDYPIIVKPVNSAGGKGVTKVDDSSGYDDAVRVAFAEADGVIYDKGNSGIVVEPFVTGRLFSVMGFIVGGEVRTWTAWEDYPFLFPFMVSSGNTIAPEDLPEARIAAAELQKIATAGNLVDGQITAQYIVQDGEPWIIEVMRRAPGNYTTTFASMATGIDWNEWIVKSELGLDCSGMPIVQDVSEWFGYTSLLSAEVGTFKDVIVDESLLDNVVDFMQWNAPGYEITRPVYDKIGLSLLKFRSPREAQDKMRRIHDLMRVEVV